MRNTTKGHLAILGTNIIFGLNIPASKALMSGWMTPLGYTLTRVLFATLLFWVAGCFTRREKVSPKDLLVIALGGLFGFTLAQTTFAVALQYTSPVKVSLIIALTPVAVMLLAAFFLKESITRHKVIGILLAVGGAAMLILHAGGGGAGVNDLLGIGIMFLNITFYAVYIIITRNVSARYSPVTLMKWMFLCNLIIIMPFGVHDFFNQPIFSTPANWNGLLVLAYVLIMATAVSYFLMPIALKRLRATTVSVYINLQPIIASVAAIVLGQDVFTWDKLAAAALVITGAYIVSRQSAQDSA